MENINWYVETWIIMISWMLNIYAKLNWIDFASISKPQFDIFRVHIIRWILLPFWREIQRSYSYTIIRIRFVHLKIMSRKFQKIYVSEKLQWNTDQMSKTFISIAFGYFMLDDWIILNIRNFVHQNIYILKIQTGLINQIMVFGIVFEQLNMI